MSRKIGLLSSLPLLLFIQACAVLHHVQIGEIENRSQFTYVPVELKVSEMGIDLKDVKALSNAFLDKKSAHDSNEAVTYLSYFQMGPHTGAGVYTLDYMTKVETGLYSQCPKGFLTGLTSIRETRKYPVISGEIIKVKGFCAIPRGS